MPLPSYELWREDLVATCVGYGEAVTGGMGGSLRIVTNLNNSGAGSLRDACETAGTAWIVFSVSGTITSTVEILVTSNKTIDGRGENITITGEGLQIGARQGAGAAAVNVIVENIKFFEVDSMAAIQIVEGAADVWVDHVTIQDLFDEGIYVGTAVDGETSPRRITVSWCKWVGQNRANGSSDKVLLISDPGLPDDVAITLTMHHNWYNQMYVRHPLGRYASVHSFNNFYDKPSIGVDGVTDLLFLSENDILDHNVSGSAPMFKTWVGGTLPGGNDPRGALSMKVVSPWLINGATYEEINTGGIFTPTYSYTPATANQALEDAIVAGAGWLDVEAPVTTIVTRAGKGSALSHTEVDANFTNLNNDKLESTVIGNVTIRNTGNTYDVGLFNSSGTELAAPFVTRKPSGVSAGNVQTWINSAAATVGSISEGGVMNILSLQMSGTSGLPATTSTAVYAIGDNTAAGNPLTGTTQMGQIIQHLGKTSATAGIEGLRVSITTDTSAFTTGVMRGVYVVNVGKQGSATATRALGVMIYSPGMSATNKVGMQYGSSTTWTGNWALFIDSTDTSHFAGPIVVGGTTINANAILDLQSTTKPFMPPRMTTTERDAVASPTAGMVIYNSTTGKLNVRGASAWEVVTSV